MTDYWVSKKQYWCKYCSIFIRDDAPSRALHENGLRHQGNKERALRDMYKTGERAIRDKESEKRQVARIEKEALAAHQAAGGPVSAEPVPSIATKPSVRAKPTDPYANYSTAASLGYIDHEAVYREEQQKLKDQRMKEGFASGWETVSQPIASTSQIPSVETDILKHDLNPEDKKHGEGDDVEEEGRKMKQPIRGTLDEHESEEAHSFKFEHKVKRMLDEDESGMQDVQSIMKKLKSREKTLREGDDDEEKKGVLDRSSWKGTVIQQGQPLIKSEKTEDGTANPPNQNQETKPVIPEEQKPSKGGGMFKKRKAPASSNRSGRQKD